jgi:hypothetical protein
MLVKSSVIPSNSTRPAADHVIDEKLNVFALGVILLIELLYLLPTEDKDGASIGDVLSYSNQESYFCRSAGGFRHKS